MYCWTLASLPFRCHDCHDCQLSLRKTPQKTESLRRFLLYAVCYCGRDYCGRDFLSAMHVAWLWSWRHCAMVVSCYWTWRDNLVVTSAAVALPNHFYTASVAESPVAVAVEVVVAACSPVCFVVTIRADIVTNLDTNRRGWGTPCIALCICVSCQCECCECHCHHCFHCSLHSCKVFMG